MIGHADGPGGADRAGLHILRAVQSVGVGAQLLVQETSGITPDVLPLAANGARRAGVLNAVARRVGGDLLWLQKSGNSVHRSFNIVPSQLTRAVDSIPHDIIHLHWMGSETASIKEIGSLKGPVVWTLHDSWPFCGAEHHPADFHDRRFALEYSRPSRSASDSRLDLDAWTYRRKRKWFTQPRWLVGPSQSMIEQASEACLTRTWPASVIPNPIDTSVFRPHARAEARRKWQIASDRIVLLFGAVGGTFVANKGWDSLGAAVGHLPAAIRNRVEVWVFGAEAPQRTVAGCPVQATGFVADPHALAALYSAADVHVVASRQESFSQTAAESIASGTPVAAFGVGGLLDVVTPGVTGSLATPYDEQDLARAIVECLERHDKAAIEGPVHARQMWEPSVVGGAYKRVYEEAIQWWNDGPSQR